MFRPYQLAIFDGGIKEVISMETPGRTIMVREVGDPTTMSEVGIDYHQPLNYKADSVSYDLYAALQLVRLSPATRQWMAKNDPKALEQINRAVQNYQFARGCTLEPTMHAYAYPWLLGPTNDGKPFSKYVHDDMFSSDWGWELSGDTIVQ